MNMNLPRPKWSSRSQQQTRNWLMFLSALGMTMYEAIAREGERPFLLTLYGSMMGLPLLLRSEDKTNAANTAAKEKVAKEAKERANGTE